MAHAIIIFLLIILWITIIGIATRIIKDLTEIGSDVRDIRNKENK